MHKTDCIWTEPDRCNCGWLQEIAKNPRRVDDEIEHLRAELADISQAAHSVLHVLDTRFDSPSLQGATDELRRAIARK